MLVDGCLIDNVPLAPMHLLKSGPNLVVHFGEPATRCSMSTMPPCPDGLN